MLRASDLRLKETRYWIIYNYVVFIIIATSFHYFRWTSMKMHGRVSMVIQTVI